jgi:tetratricopeptide (TPR) repeat protein
MGNYYDNNRRPDLARTYYQQALDKDPKYVEALNNLAAIEIRERNFQGAIRYLQQAVQIDPAYPLAYLNLGVAHENSGDREAALAAYRRYVDLGGEQAPEVRTWIAEMEP